MKTREIVPLNEMLKRIQKIRKIYTFLDKLTFFHIFSIWTVIVVLFGLGYSFFSTSSSFLSHSSGNLKVVSILDGIYFSFITATSTGFGDIIPHGFFRVISIFEVVFGLLLLAFVTSKLISIKQDIILGEIYEISFGERISRIRSSLLLFRQNLNRIIDRAENNTIWRREISDLYIHFSSFENILAEISTMYVKGTTSKFTKVIDSVNTELLLYSTLKSFEKLDELITTLNTAKIDWKRDLTLSVIGKCMGVNESLFSKIMSIGSINEKSINELNTQKNKVIESIKGGLIFGNNIEKVA